MKKHIIRTLIAVLVVGLIGYLIYFFAFKPSPDITTYNSLKSYQNHTQSNAVAWDAYNGCGYVDDESTMVKQLYTKILSTENSILEYHTLYTSFAKDVKASSQRAVNKLIKSSTSNWDSFVSSVNDANNYYARVKDTISGSSSQKLELTGYNKIVRKNLHNLAVSLGNLNMELKSFVASYVFGGSYAVDFRAVHYDMQMLAINNFLTKMQSPDVVNYEINNSSYLNTVNILASATTSITDAEKQGEILSCYQQLNISTTSDGKGETYISKVFKIKYSEQQTLAAGGTVESIFGAGGSGELLEAAQTLFHSYGF